MNSNLLSAIFLTFIGGSFCSVGLAENIADATSSDEFCTQIKDDQGKLNSSRYVTIGGMDQWVAIKGTKYANPIVLIAHGGPGNPLSLYHDSLFQRWGREFTIVHWDQRGSGKTYEANQDIGELITESLAITELTTDLLVSDGLELTDYIRKKFDREKIIISGTSWGSVLAINMAFNAPQKYDFYLGVSQLVNYSKNMAASYNLVKEKATEMNDQVAIDTLSGIGPPPWRDPRSFGKLRKIIRAYEYSTV